MNFTRAIADAAWVALTKLQASIFDGRVALPCLQSMPGEAEMMLKEKTAVITGAGSGYGAGIARRFAAEGARVVVADINVQGGEKTVSEIVSTGGQASFVRVDVSKGEQVAALLASATAAFGQVHIVVNNAATTHRRQPICDVPEEEFDRLFSVNVKSIYHSARVFAPYFKSVGGGVFVNVASIVAHRPAPGLAWYNGTKAAVINISKSMAQDFGRWGIRVNCVNPGVGDTGLLALFMGEPDTPELRERYRAGIPLGRFTRPEDVAAACLYLASDDAEFITGTQIDCDGGRSTTA